MFAAKVAAHAAPLIAAAEAAHDAPTAVALRFVVSLCVASVVDEVESSLSNYDYVSPLWAALDLELPLGTIRLMIVESGVPLSSIMYHVAWCESWYGRKVSADAAALLAELGGRPFVPWCA